MAYRFWGKTAPGPEGWPVAWLPLEDHCVDVAVVLRRLCEQSGFRRSLSHAAARPLSSIDCDRLAVLSCLHDLGKCNWGFQARFDPTARDTAGHLREVLALFYDSRLSTAFAEAIDFDTIVSWFRDHQSAAEYLHVLLAHHGRPHPRPSSEAETDRTARFWRVSDGIDPFAGIAELLAAARAAFPGAFAHSGQHLPVSPRFQHRFAGLLMLADWLGSHSEGFFPFEHSAPDRPTFAAEAAARAITTVGLDIEPFREDSQVKARGFRNIFGFPPNSLQSTLAEHTDGQTIVVESATGSGKTEAALAHFLQRFRQGVVDSLYFALPTRVAARELYGRVLAFTRRTFGDGHPPVVLAVPGYAAVDGEPPSCLPDPRHQYNDEPRDVMRDRSWAAERPKRFLAAPIAVGTIDQALLSILQVPHAHLRSICLDRSLLVADEVHASDTYVHNLLRVLLAHHRSIGGRALLLSATLGASARAELLTAPGDPAPVTAFSESAAVPYPAVTSEQHAPVRIASNEAPGVQKVVTLDPVTALDDPEVLLPRLRDATSRGARVLAVMNTVNRAISLQRAAEQDGVLSASLFDCSGVRCPHHGRFARVDREALDAEVSARLGKDSAAGALLLIGTQTLEQSLDIDADWLVTDLCPVDVLLQRIGRLHRHSRDRPSEFEAARCTVLMPTDRSFDRFFDERGRVHGQAGLGLVYPDLRIARLTAELVDGEGEVHLPRDNRRLVEYATHPEQLERFREGPWQGHRNELLGTQLAHGRAATDAVIPETPFDELRFSDFEGSLTTRLGLGDRRIILDHACTSPFGNRLTEITIPGWMVARDVEGEVPDGPVVAADGSVSLQYGGRVYEYSRYGLERTDAS